MTETSSHHPRPPGFDKMTQEIPSVKAKRQDSPGSTPLLKGDFQLVGPRELGDLRMRGSRDISVAHLLGETIGPEKLHVGRGHGGADGKWFLSLGQEDRLSGLSAARENLGSIPSTA